MKPIIYGSPEILSPLVIEISISAYHESERELRDMKVKPRLNEMSLALFDLNNKLSMSYLNSFMLKTAFFNISGV